MRVKQFLSETVAMYPQYWSRVVQVSSTNPIPYASVAMVGRCRSTMRWLEKVSHVFCYPEFWGKYDENRRNKLIRESIFIRSTWNNIFFCKKYFVGPRWKALKTIALHTKKNFRLWDKNHAPFKLNGQSRIVFGLLKAPELQRLYRSLSKY